MSGYLGRLSARVTGGLGFLRPRIPSRYEGLSGAESRLDSFVEKTVEPRREPAVEPDVERLPRSSPSRKAARTTGTHRVVQNQEVPEEIRKPFGSDSHSGLNLKPRQASLPSADQTQGRRRKISPPSEETWPRDAVDRSVAKPLPPPEAAMSSRSPEELAHTPEKAPVAPRKDFFPARPQSNNRKSRNREPEETLTPLPAESTSSRIPADATEVLEAAEKHPLPSDEKRPHAGDGNEDPKSNTDPSTPAAPVQTIVRSVPADDQGPVVEVRINRIELNAATEPPSAKKQAQSSRALKEIPSLAEYLGHKGH